MTVEAPFVMSGGHVVRGGQAVLNSIDFTVDAGQFVVLMGANGSGKTTLVKSLLGLLPLSGGSVEIFGRPRDRFKQWHRIGYVPQRFTAASVVPATVGEIVLSGRISRAARLRPWSGHDRARAADSLELVGLGHLRRRPIATLSGGQQQRVLIARALAGEPDVLVLDEPAAGIDIDSQDSFATTLQLLNNQGHTVLLVAHELGAMEPLVSRAVLLELGRVAYDGPPLPHLVHHEHIHHHPEMEADDLRGRRGPS